MPLPKFDNLNDVTSKFVSTVCYYQDEPVFVKTAFHGDDDPNKFLLSIAALGKNSQIIDVHDPNFRYVNYNLGYANSHTAIWWYRRPAKQYQQGLKAEQLRYYSEDGHDLPKSSFAFAKPYVHMLSNLYPSITEAEKSVRDGAMHKAAWHRDFAIGYDGVEKQYDLYYRANKIGIFGGAKEHLFPASFYVKEALQEALSQCNN